MDFETLKGIVPYVMGGKQHILEFRPYNGVTLRFPGRHQLDTEPPGGDFVVCVDDAMENWTSHQFTHVDIFKDIERKLECDPDRMQKIFAPTYAKVIMGQDPDMFAYDLTRTVGIHERTFMYAAQCLALAEHRRYHQFEKGGGGRYLPARYALGIIFGNWKAVDAAEHQRRGIHGLRILTKEFGNPPTLRSLL